MRSILSDLDLLTVGDASAWAVTSRDDAYRYLLGRLWDDVRPLWVFAMLNPSRARIQNDPTVRKCVGFATRGGAGGIIIVNALAFSNPNPARVVQAHKSGIDVVGSHNEAAMRWALAQVPALGRCVGAWGRVPPTLLRLAEPGLGLFSAQPFDCLGVNADGSPRHPARLGYATPIVPYGAP